MEHFKSYMIRKRNKVQLEIGCASLGCSFIVRARARSRKHGGNVHITSSYLKHDCSGLQKRKRNVKTDVLQMLHPLIPSFTPTTVSKYYYLTK